MDARERELLDDYIARGAEAWNGSLEAAWLDYELRRFVLAALPARRPLLACNVGIGVGLWDDWLARTVEAAITSVDRDPDICRRFAYRQHRERHPMPSRVVCGDVRDGALGDARFDAITCIGSTLAESGDRGATIEALRRALVPGGRLLLAEVGEGDAPAGTLAAHGLWLAPQVIEG